MEPLRIGVVGGGITGLAAARRLTERLSILGRPFEVHVFEASARLGGIVRTEKQDGYLLEQGPDCFVSDKPRGVQLCQELGLARDFLTPQPENRRSFIAWKGRLHPVPEGFHLIAPSLLGPMLLSPLLSWKGKCRLLKEFFIPTHALEDESLASFVTRRMGPEVLERLAQPLAGGIYSGDPQTLSLQATFPKFLEMERRGGVLRYMMKESNEAVQKASGARYSVFVTLRSGLQTIIDQLTQRLTNAKIQLNSAVQSVQRGSGRGWTLTLQDDRSVSLDGICLALPAFAVARLVQPLEPGLSALLQQVPYTDSLVAHFAFNPKNIRHPMNGFGFVVPTAEKRTMSACTFMHRKFAQRAPEGVALLRIFVGGAAAAALRGVNAEEVHRRLLSDLKIYLGVSGEPLLKTLARYQQALPQYLVGHVARLKEIEERLHALDTLTAAGNWRRGVGLPDCIESGEQAAETLVNALCRI